MPIAASRRVGVAGLLGLLAGALVLMLTPGNPGALRLAGIGLSWWYAAVVAPLAALLLVVVGQRAAPRPPSRRPMALAAAAVAAWPSPVLLGLVAARGFAGGSDAPALALAALVAPLVAFLVPASSGERRPDVVTAVTISAAAGCVVWANLLLVADVAGLLGLP